MKNRSFVLVLFVAVTLLQSQIAQAQSVNITGPTSPVTVQTGDDFATNVLRNPWDFDQRRDIGWEENFVGTSVGVSNGIWSGTNELAGGYVLPLFPGFKRSVFPYVTPGDTSLPALGILSPIDASKYTRVCYRLSHTSRGTYALYWDNNPNRDEYWPDGSQKGATIDGFYTTQSSTAVMNSGYRVYCHDMTNLSGEFQQSAGSWSGNIHAFRLDPSVGGGAGAVTEIDWIRIVDPSSAPNLNITWSSSGVTSSHVVTVYLDNNNSGFDGAPIARYSSGSNPGSYTLPTASLPPGDHYFYVEVQAAGTGTSGLIGSPTRSGYSARLRITNAPVVNFSSPSFTSGQEYFGSVVGNAIDMDSSTDVINLDRSRFPDSARQFSNEQFITNSDTEDGKIFAASADTPINGATESDDQLHLNVNSTRPIDPQKFRYLVYRMAADGTNFPRIDNKVRDGWVTRPVWWNNDVLSDGGDPGAHVLYEGWHTYNLDLSALPMERGHAWSTYSNIRNLRIDPLETNIPTWFYIDWIRLHAENRTSNKLFTINYSIADADSSAFDVSLYYDNNNSGFDGSLITSISGLSAGNHSFVWNTDGFPEGASYYVYAVVSDGTNVRKYYTPVHVKIGDYVPQPVPRTSGSFADYNGDGSSDLFLYYDTKSVTTSACLKYKTKKVKVPGQKKKVSVRVCSKQRTVTNTENNVSHTYNSASGEVTRNIHTAGSSGISFDRTGDGYADLTTVRESDGSLVWDILESRTAHRLSIPFGVSGDKPVTGDFDGDGKDDIAIFRPSTGEWYILNNSLGVNSEVWGQSGDIPVPRDFDGDGSTDLAVYRPSNGTWYIKNSGYSSGYASAATKTVSFGSADDLPVAADYNGDGVDEVAVYRPSEGNWYVMNLRDSSTSTTQWGMAGDVPHARLDTNNDGLPDFVIFRASEGAWYINYGNGQNRRVAFGDSAGRMLLNKQG